MQTSLFIHAISKIRVVLVNEILWHDKLGISAYISNVCFVTVKFKGKKQSPNFVSGVAEEVNYIRTDIALFDMHKIPVDVIRATLKPF